MSHVIMKKNLAKALMESSMHDVSPEHVQKFGLGGIVSSILGGGGGSSPANYAPPPIVKQNFLPQIQTLQGQQKDVYGQQQSLANTLLNQSNGQGPNPAQEQLAQNTGTNVANQAALAAGQRGASANPGAVARTAAQQGGAIQQNAAGQAATLQAQQDLSAQQQLEQQYSNMANQSIAGEGLQQTGQAAQNTAITSGGNEANALNEKANEENQTSNNALVGGLLSAAGPALAFAAPGIKTAIGGLFGGSGGGVDTTNASNFNANGEYIGKYKGGEIESKSFSRALLDGGEVPGEAKVSGDSLKNDTEKTMLSPGEIVLPRSITQSPDAVKKAAEFVAHLKNDKKSKSKDYGSVIEARKSLKDRVEHLEKLCMGGYAKGA